MKDIKCGYLEVLIWLTFLMTCTTSISQRWCGTKSNMMISVRWLFQHPEQVIPSSTLIIRERMDVSMCLEVETTTNFSTICLYLTLQLVVGFYQVFRVSLLQRPEQVTQRQELITLTFVWLEVVNQTLYSTIYTFLILRKILGLELMLLEHNLNEDVATLLLYTNARYFYLVAEMLKVKFSEICKV